MIQSSQQPRAKFMQMELPSTEPQQFKGSLTDPVIRHYEKASEEYLPQSPTIKTQMKNQFNVETQRTSNFKACITSATSFGNDQGHTFVAKAVVDSIQEEMEERSLRYQDFPGDEGGISPESDRDHQVQPLRYNEEVLQDKSSRKDRFNKPITTEKQHQVSFRDQVTRQRLADVIIVTNWKHYHRQVTDDDDCCCFIF